MVKYLYELKNSDHKTTLWECFGDILIENLRLNVEKVNIYCLECGELIIRQSSTHKFCNQCWKEQHKHHDREYQIKKRKRSTNDNFVKTPIKST